MLAYPIFHMMSSGASYCPPMLSWSSLRSVSGAWASHYLQDFSREASHDLDVHWICACGGNFWRVLSSRFDLANFSHAFARVSRVLAGACSGCLRPGYLHAPTETRANGRASCMTRVSIVNGHLATPPPPFRIPHRPVHLFNKNSMAACKHAVPPSGHMLKRRRPPPPSYCAPTSPKSGYENLHESIREQANLRLLDWCPRYAPREHLQQQCPQQLLGCNRSQAGVGVDHEKQPVVAQQSDWSQRVIGRDQILKLDRSKQGSISSIPRIASTAKDHEHDIHNACYPKPV